MSQKNKIRQSNIELCRIVCMLLIIAHHCVVHGGGIGMNTCVNRYTALFFLPGGKFCFDAFLAISTWFLVDQTFKSERFLKTWCQVLFYSVTFAAISAYMGVSLTKRNWFSVFFPITGNSHGFAASYLAFYLLMPFLGITASKLTKKQLQWLILLLLYFQVTSQIIGTVSQYFQPIHSELQLFVLCYFLALYIKRYPLPLLFNRIFLFTTVILMWFLVFFIWCLAAVFLPGNAWVGVLSSLCNDESSILYLIGGYAFFLLFYTLRIPTNQYINAIAHTTFGILLIHDHNFFRYVLWNQIFHAQDWWYSRYFLIHILLCVFIIFVVGALIDHLRQKYIERFIFSLPLVSNLEKQISKSVPHTHAYLPDADEHTN